jgi:hypothetical protein
VSLNAATRAERFAAVHESGCGNTTEVFGGAAIPSDYRGTFSVLTRQAACLFVTQC